MILSKVTGNIVATQKDQELSGHKLLLTHPIDLQGKLIGENELIAIDLIDAGIGDTVLVTKEGAAVKQILGHSNAPVNAIITAIVDNIDLKE